MGCPLQAHTSDTPNAQENLMRLGNRLYDQTTGLPWLPSSYTLTAPDGTHYQLDSLGHISAVTFSDGAQWLISGAGIVANNGDISQREDIQRDSLGRINLVTGPNSQNQTVSTVYRYDSLGRLALVRDLNSPGLGNPVAYDELGKLFTGTITAQLGAAVNWLGNSTTNQWTGTLNNTAAATTTATTLTFSVRDSELNSTVHTPGAKGSIVYAIETSLPADATLSISGATIIGNATVNGKTTYLVRVTEAGTKLIQLNGTGIASLRISVAGDLNRDGLVDGTDSQTWTQQAQTNAAQADLNGDGLSNATDRQLLYANYGFKANQAPTVVANLPQGKTHTDLATQVNVNSIAQDAEGDSVYLQILSATHSNAKLSKEGTSIVFTPEAGYTGLATITMQADDGYAQSAPISLTVNVSGAALEQIHISRLATLSTGTARFMTITGDFADEKGVTLTGNYLQYTSSNTGVASVNDQGLVKGLGAGTAIVQVKARGIEGVNVFTVATDPHYPTLDDNGFEVDVYPRAITLPLQGQRQLKVTLPDHTSISAAASGTRYFISDSNIADITADGLIHAKATGTVILSIINGGMQHDIQLNVVVPIVGQGTVHVGQGLVVQDQQGDNMLMLAPGALPEGASASIQGLNFNDLGMPLPASTLLDALGAFEIKIEGGKTDLPMQLAIKVQAPIDSATGQPKSLPVGTQVAFWRKGTILDTDGTSHDTWWLVDNGFVGADGVARTASPPYSGITGGSGKFVITSIDEDNSNPQTGEYQVKSTTVYQYDAFWGPTDNIAYRVGATIATGVLNLWSMVSSAFGLRFTLEGSYKKEIPGTAFKPQNIADQFPAAPSFTVNTPVITGLNYNREDNTLTVNGQNFIPPNMAASGYQLKVWLVPRGEQLYNYSKIGNPLDRGLVWQGFDAPTNSSQLKVTLPKGVALSMHDVYVERTAIVPTADGGSTTVAVDSNPVQAWSLGTTNSFATRADRIEVFQTSVEGGVASIAQITQDENGNKLSLSGAYTDQIAYSYDGSLAFIAAQKNQIYVIDTQTLQVVYTIKLAGGGARLTSLAVTDRWLYATEGERYGSGSSRLLRINIDQMSDRFLKDIQTIKFDYAAPYGFQDMAINNGTYLAITAPQSPWSIYSINRPSNNQGNIYFINLNQIDSFGNIVDTQAVATLKSEDFPQNRGKYPQFITSGSGEGEFLVTDQQDYNSGFTSIIVKRTEKGAMTGDFTVKSMDLRPQDTSGTTISGWYNKKFRQNIQQADDTVIVEYDGIEYALVSDFNFIYNEFDFWQQFDEIAPSNLANKQIGGKIGIIQDPFGKKSGPKYLGATTPIVGGNIQHLGLAANGSQLYADVWFYNEPLNEWRSYKSLFVWNTSAIIEAALDAQKESQESIIPIDRIATIPGEAGRRPGTAPIRYDRLYNPNDDTLGWLYDVNAYSVPGRPYQLGKVKINYTPLQLQGGDYNIYKDMLGIDSKQIQTQLENGTYNQSAFAYMAGNLAYNGWNFFTLGVLDKQAERYNQLSNGSISEASYYTATTLDSVASIASIAVGGRIASGATARFGEGLWGAVKGGIAEAVLSTVIQKEGEILSYELTDPTKLNGAYAKQAATELTLATVLGAGLPLIGGLMSGAGRSNAKVLANSPNELNPTLFKIVQPTVSIKSTQLLGSVADSTGGGILSHAGGQITTAGGVVVQLPGLASYNTQSAINWLADLSPKLKTMVNPNASPWEQAVQAVQLENDFMLIARNAMDDANAAAQLSMTTPIRTFEELLADANKKGFYGDAAYREVMDTATREMTTYRKVGDSGGCFAAGTMIHTRDGLKPIEDIHIGDWVLSKPESGEGESTYKKVVRTTCFENKPVYRVRRCTSGHKTENLIVTGNHPFWVVGYEPNYFPPDWDEPIEIGWTRADRLDRGMLLLLADGQIGQVSMIDPIWRTKTEGVGWIDRGRDSYQPREDGHLIDLRNGKIEEDFNKYVLSEFLDEYSFLDRDCDSEFAEEWGYKCTVYNFEVEDFHTYFVGELGVWVHNTNCFADSIKPTKIKNVLRSPDLDVYYSKADAGDLVATMQKPKGQILLYEPISDPTRPWVKFQDGVEGGLRSKDGSYFLARTLLYKNPVPNGRNIIALGDGAAYIRDNGKLILSKTTIV